MVATGSYSSTAAKITVKIPNHTRGLLLLVVLLGCFTRVCKGSGSGKFGLKIHGRFSDPVKQIFNSGDALPEKGTAGYFTALVHRDFAVHGRRLSSNPSPLTFAAGNITYQLSMLGYLHYANVIVGTPGLSFLVALDTGSDLFWLPCDCVSCISSIRLGSNEIDFNIYSLKTSSTGRKIPCDSPLCEHRCSTSSGRCSYKVMYLSENTASSGYLVEDVLHLAAYNNSSKPLNADVTFGCGRNQTGSFLEGGAPNGLLGLGLGSISVPSMLASENIAANSFSMCFEGDGTGRIVFGDQGSSDHGETPFHLKQFNPHYNISITHITVGTDVSRVHDVYAIFDTGTSFTYLNDPAYTLIMKKFDSLVNDSRLPVSTDPNIPFEYCYESSSSQSSMPAPSLNLTMQGGYQFHVTDPRFPLPTESGYVYCVAILKSEDVNIIGQNFMTGYRVVFDRERMVLGWKASDCNEALDTNSFPVSPQSPTHNHPKPSEEPQATVKNGSASSGTSSTWRRDFSHLKSAIYLVIVIFLQLLLIL